MFQWKIMMEEMNKTLILKNKSDKTLRELNAFSELHRLDLLSVHFILKFEEKKIGMKNPRKNCTKKS